MAIKIQGTTIIDDAANVSNICMVTTGTICSNTYYGCGSGLCGVPVTKVSSYSCKCCLTNSSCNNITIDLCCGNYYQIRSLGPVNVSCVCNINYCNKLIIETLGNSLSSKLTMPSCFAYACSSADQCKVTTTFEDVGNNCWIGNYYSQPRLQGDNIYNSWQCCDINTITTRLGCIRCVSSSPSVIFCNFEIERAMCLCGSNSPYALSNFAICDAQKSKGQLSGFCYNNNLYGIGIGQVYDAGQGGAYTYMRFWRVNPATGDLDCFRCFALGYYDSTYGANLSPGVIISVSPENDFFVTARRVCWFPSQSCGSSCIVVYSLSDAVNNGTLVPLQYICACGDTGGARGINLYCQSSAIPFHNMDVCCSPAKLIYKNCCNCYGTCGLYVRKFWKGTAPCYVCSSDCCLFCASTISDPGLLTQEGDYLLHSCCCCVDTSCCHLCVRVSYDSLNNCCTNTSFSEVVNHSVLNVVCNRGVFITDCRFCHIGHITLQVQCFADTSTACIKTRLANGTYISSYSCSGLMCNCSYGPVWTPGGCTCGCFSRTPNFLGSCTAEPFLYIDLQNNCMYSALKANGSDSLSQTGSRYCTNTCTWVFGTGCCYACSNSGYCAYGVETTISTLLYRNKAPDGSIIDVLGGPHELSNTKLFSC